MTAAIMLPWLNPFAPGPSPAVVPWLVALAATACLILLTLLRTSSGDAIGGATCAQRWACLVAWAWLLAGLLSSAIGLWQYFGAGSGFLPWINQTQLGEAFGNLRQRNQFASLTNMALAALLWLALSGRVSAKREPLSWLAACLLAAGAAASSSRTGLLQLVLLCLLFGVWGAWRQRLIRRLLLAALLSYALATLLLPWLAGLDPSVHGSFARLRSGDVVCASRLTLWSNVLQLIAQKPWSGWGWGELDYAHYMTLYPGARFCDILDNAHNLPLHLAVELGIPLALLFCSLLTWLILRARPWRESDATRQLAWSVLALIGLHSLLEYPLWYGPFQIALGLCLGLLWMPTARAGETQLQVQALTSNSRFALWVRGFVAIIMIVLSGYAAYDYYRVSQIYLAPGARDAAYRDDTLIKISGTRLFASQYHFAQLSLTPLTAENAAQMHALSSALLHYSPEPRVIEKLIDSALLLERDDEASLHIARYRAAFPKEYEQWRKERKLGDAPRPGALLRVLPD